MKIRCDSNCRPCVFEGGNSRDISDQFNAHYCSACREAFFCEVGVVQHFSPSNRVSYSCVDCGVPLLNKPLDEISMLQARFSIKDHSRGGYSAYDKKFASRKEFRSFKTLSMLYNT